MSRIDEALRAWESSVGLARTDDAAIPRSGRTTVTDYAREAEDEQATGFLRESDYAREAGPPLQEPSSPVEPAVSRWVETTVAPPPPAPPSRVAPVPQPAPRALDVDAAARLVTVSTSAITLEQYRRLAATLHEAQVSNGLKTVMLTSALPNEGKTLTTVNLAFTLSDSYARRVLVIDADLRYPCLHSLLGISNASGLSELLADERAEIPFTEISERLHVLTAGRPGPMPLAGLSSPRMGTLLEECARRFDWVLLDTPPVGVLPDAQLLARLAGAVILVIGANSTPAAFIERAVAELGPECIIGTVLNRVGTHVISEAGYVDRYHSR